MNTFLIIGFFFTLFTCGCLNTSFVYKDEIDFTKTKTILFCESKLLKDSENRYCLVPYGEANVSKDVLTLWWDQLADAKKETNEAENSTLCLAYLILIDERGAPIGILAIGCQNALVLAQKGVIKISDSTYDYAQGAESTLLKSEPFVRSVYEYMRIHFPEKVVELNLICHFWGVTLESLLFNSQRGNSGICAENNF